VENDPDEMIQRGLDVLDQALSLDKRIRLFSSLVPLFSGGYDSLCACYIASKHRKFGGRVYHIDTGIGSAATRVYVDQVCKEMDWKLEVLQSPATYESFVSTLGFPGPGSHQWVYNWLKDRCVQQITQGTRYKLLITGCRSEESTRRMGHVQPIKIGERSKESGKTMHLNRLWIAPCHDWTSENQRTFMNEMGFPRNPIKDSLLGMSGECFCGAFARPNEREMIKEFAPDVDRKITRLEVIAKECGIEERNCTWGYRKGRKVEEVVETGPMCNSCDRKASAAGIIIKDCS